MKSIHIEKVAHSSIVGSSLMVKDGPAGRCIAVLKILNAHEGKDEEIAEAVAALCTRHRPTPQETALLNKLSDAVQDFILLPGRHVDDKEFERQVHRLQDMILARVGFRAVGGLA